MAVSLIPESAPFSSEQRAWLNGFFAGLLHLNGANGDGAALAGVGPTASAAIADAPAAEDFPWHDPAIPLPERMALAEEQPLARRLMAAMAQLDCGACGYVCQTYSEAIANGTEKDLTRCSPGGGETARALKQLVQIAPVAPPNGKPTAAAAPSTAYSRNTPFPARLIESRRLTHPDAAKDTRHVAIDLLDSGLTYEPGDALGILPLNCPELVAGVLAALRAEGGERVPMSDGGSQSLRDALAGDYSLTRPRGALLETLAQFAANSDEAQHLQHLVDNGEADDFLAPLDVLDVLTRFPSARPQLVEFVAALGKLQPRLYSISSSQRMHPREVHLTVGVVRYESQGKWVQGVASNFLGVRSQPGDEVRVYVQKSPRFRLPADPETPIIMVGPGTGIAPFRAFLEEREANSARGKSWLIFGNQHFHYDFLYREELDRWCDSGVLSRLDVAFSRDSAQKVYVQDKMRENAAELWAWLKRGAYFYVCGDAKKMAVDVDQALNDIAAQQGGISAADAKSFVQSLVKEKRYLKDVY